EAIGTATDGAIGVGSGRSTSGVPPGRGGVGSTSGPAGATGRSGVGADGSITASMVDSMAGVFDGAGSGGIVGAMDGARPGAVVAGSAGARGVAAPRTRP